MGGGLERVVGVEMITCYWTRCDENGDRYGRLILMIFYERERASADDTVQQMHNRSFHYD